jgi:hypothetical protein
MQTPPPSNAPWKADQNIRIENKDLYSLFLILHSIVYYKGMSFDPFRGNGDGSSLEQEDPIGGAAKQAAKAVNNQTQQQAQAAKQSFVDQLYGNVANSPESLDPSADPAHALAQTGTSSQTTPTPSGGLQQAANPNEQSKLEETRRKLAEFQKQHNETYFSKTFGEEAQKRAEQEAEEVRLKEQQEEEEKEAERVKREQMEESLQSFTQHGKGPTQLGDPVSVTQAKTKTEINRGTSG